MPFLLPLPIIFSGKSNNPHKHNVNKISRKEGRPEYSRNIQFFLNIEKASASASRGSITVEAAFCIPLFLYAAVSLIWLLEIQALRTAVISGMHEAGKRIAQETYVNPIFTAAQAELEIVKSIGADRLERSLTVGGSRGLKCGKSIMYPDSNIIVLHVQYQVRIPIPVLAIPSVSQEENMRVKCWTGYVKEGFSYSPDTTIVYVTETGVVYHLDYHCTYLELSIRSVPAEKIESLRNESHGKYHPCERCMNSWKDGGTVFITNFGDRYHSSLSCSGLKRKVYAVPLEEVKGKGACSKCGK